MRTGALSTLSLLGGLAIAAPTPELPVGLATTVKNLHISILGVINDIAQECPAFSNFSTTGGSLNGFRDAYFPSNCPPIVGLPAPATSAAEAIQYLQQVQLDLDIITQDMIIGDTADASSLACATTWLYGSVSNFVSSLAASSSAIAPTSSGGVITSSLHPISKTTTVASSTSGCVSPTASTDCTTQEDKCRKAPNANQSFCSYQAAQCQSTCSAAFSNCSTAPNANHAYCASQYAGCLGYNPFTTTSSATVGPTTTSSGSPTSKTTSASTTSASPTPTPTDCSTQEDTCRTAPNANQSFCSAQAASCKSTCLATYNACSSAPGGSQAYCSSQYAACLGYNPFTTTSVTPSMTTMTSTTSFVCNLAHSYPSPASCVERNGTITFVTTLPGLYATATGSA